VSRFSFSRHGLGQQTGGLFGRPHTRPGRSQDGTSIAATGHVTCARSALTPSPAQRAAASIVTSGRRSAPVALPNWCETARMQPATALTHTKRLHRCRAPSAHHRDKQDGASTKHKSRRTSRILRRTNPQTHVACNPGDRPSPTCCPTSFFEPGPDRPTSAKRNAPGVIDMSGDVSTTRLRSLVGHLSCGSRPAACALDWVTTLIVTREATGAKSSARPRA
jgi:hypothetical protein